MVLYLDPSTRRPGATLALVASLLIACAPAAAADWRSDPIWDDGNAEFCVYELDWRRYGELFPGRALTILVKEPWAPELDVKADTARADGFDVLKLNFVRDVPTGIYTYHQMASVFLRRDDGSLRKLVATSSEGCGITTAEMVGGELTTSSYFDGQGRRSLGWPSGAVPEDGLAALARDWVAGPAPGSVELFPSLLAGRLPELEASEWRVERREVSGVELPAGRFDAVELRLEQGGEWMSYLFEPQPPHRLLRLHQSDGSDYRLAKCERIPYWRMNRSGGESWLPEDLR